MLFFWGNAGGRVPLNFFCLQKKNFYDVEETKNLPTIYFVFSCWLSRYIYLSELCGKHCDRYHTLYCRQRIESLTNFCCDKNQRRYRLCKTNQNIICTLCTFQLLYSIPIWTMSAPSMCYLWSGCSLPVPILLIVCMHDFTVYPDFFFWKLALRLR